MSIFSDLDIKSFDKHIIEKLYEVEYDRINDVSIKKMLVLKYEYRTDPAYSHNTIRYYNPMWLFYMCMIAACARIRPLAKDKFRNRATALSKMDVGNIQTRFDRIIKDCKSVEFENTKYIDIDQNEKNIFGLRTDIENMMVGYIKDVNWRHLKKTKDL